MEQSLISNIKQNKALMYGIVGLVIGAFILVVFLIATTLAPRTSYEVTSLNIKNSSVFSQLKNNKLYTYNGASFTVKNVSSNAPAQILHPGIKLPIASQVEWADDKGAIMRFSSGFTYTEIENYLEQNDISLFSDYSDYTWYVDFKNDSIHLVSTEPLLSEDFHYSEKANGFYFALNTSTESPDNLAFYNIDTKETSFVESLPPLSIVTSINDCFDKDSVCVSATDFTENAEPTIYRIKVDDGKISKLVSASGTINPTGDEDIYLVNEVVDDADSREDGAVNADQHSDVDLNLAPGKLYNIKTKEYENTSNGVDDNLTVLIDKTNKDVAYFSFEQGSSYTSSAKTIFGSTTTRNEQLINSDSSDIYIPLSYGSSVSALVSDAESNLYIIAPRDYIKSDFKVPTEGELSSIVESCKNNSTDDLVVDKELQTITIYVMAGDSFLRNVRQVATCFAEKPSNWYGYSFIFKGINPENGRIIIS